MQLDLSNIKDMDLVSRSKTLRETEHESMTALLQHLIEIEKRRLDLDMGYSSLFDYCVNYLEYSGASAGRRIQAARCIRRFPVVLDMLEKHELELCSIAQIESILTDDNYMDILERVKGGSYRDVEKVACELRPPLKFRDRVRPVRVAVQTAAAASENAPAMVAATIQKKMLVQFLASEELVAKFEEVKTLLSSGNPNVSFADIVEVLATEYLERHRPRNRQERRESRNLTTRSDKKTARRVSKNEGASLDSQRWEWKKTQARDIPNAVKDRVFVRDGGQCVYVAPNGTRCSSTHGLQIDHIRPFAAGGTHEDHNLRLLCAAHNRRAAEITMGPQVMKPYWRQL